MIIIRNGNLVSRVNTNITQIDLDAKENDVWKNSELTDECWMFMIPTDISNMCLFNAKSNGVEYFVPYGESKYEDYEMFWETELTVLFASEEEAIDYMKNYEGPLAHHIKEYHTCVLEQKVIKETLLKYSCICNVAENSNDELFEEFEEMMFNHVDSDSFLETMKLFILETYRNDFELALLVD